MVEKREFKAPWKEAEYSMHETHPTPSHVSQKWMDMFSFGKKSSIGYDGEDDKGERHEKKQTDTTFGSQRIASQLLQSLQDKETSSQRVLPVNQMDVIAKRFDDVDQQMQRALDHIKQISVVLDEMKDGQKDMMGMDTIIERVSDAVLAFHAAKAHNKQDDGDGCFGETGARKRCDPNADDSDTLKHVVLKERMRKKCKKETVMFHASSQESCSSHR